jgi:L-iditol 2-dehydrogenase
MKALVLLAPSELAYTDVDAPEPGAGETLVEVRACGICGSDVHGFDGSTGRRLPPLVMGHEAAGVVAAAGSGVGRWRPGDRVAFDSTICCGECEYCRSGRSNLCLSRAILGVSTPEHRKDGAFAEYVTVPERLLVAMPDDLRFEEAALAEPVAVALHAVARAETASGESAVVVGTGVIGLLVIQVLRAAGVDKVIGIDLDAARLRLARELGATHVLDADLPELADAVLEATGGRLADVALEAVGTPAAVQTAIGCVRRGGRVVLIGNLAARVDIPLQRVIADELTLNGSAASAGEYKQALDLLAAGVVDVSPLISAVAPLSEGVDWFRRLREREPGLLKVVLTP